ncbi:MAG: hypothetical protein KBB71_00275 [Lentimicrobiaceae bacterium]|nr:hypothetical protein [Lentimicrobiaceae bacterium]
MKIKLTLTIDEELLPAAKVYAKKTGRSLSDLIENYLKSLVREPAPPIPLSPLVRSLMGSFPLSDDFCYRAELVKAIHEKYE